MTDKDIEQFIHETNSGKPKMEWLKVRKGQFDYLYIKGCPKGIYLIKNCIRRTYVMYKGRWMEVSVFLLLDDLKIRFEKLFKEKKINFDDYKEVIEESEAYDSPNFDEE